MSAPGAGRSLTKRPSAAAPAAYRRGRRAELLELADRVGQRGRSLRTMQSDVVFALEHAIEGLLPRWTSLSGAGGSPQ